MTSIVFDKICQNENTGSLYTVEYIKNNHKTPIYLKIDKTKSIFGLETRYNSHYFKWIIDYNVINNIQLLEKMLVNSFTEYDIDTIKSKLCIKNNYPTMIETKINKNTSSSDIIKHEPGEIITFNMLKNQPCSIKLHLRNISIQNKHNKNIMFYNLEICEIALIHDK